MTENDNSQYRYDEMANLVLRADHRLIDKPKDDVTGEPETLSGKISLSDIGSRVVKPKMTIKEKEYSRNLEKRESLNRNNNNNNKINYNNNNNLYEDDDIEGLNYFPKTNTSKEAFNLIMTWTHEILDDMPHSTVRSAADIIISVLKSNNEKDIEKKKQINEILGTNISDIKFTQLTNLCKKIDDYDSYNNQVKNENNQIDDNLGVAVVFDKDEDDLSDDDDDEENDNNNNNEYDDDDLNPEGDEENSDFEVDSEIEADLDNNLNSNSNSNSIIKDNKNLNKKTQNGKLLIVGDNKTLLKNNLDVHDIDAFWLQRLLSNIYKDPHDVQEKSAATFALLESQIPQRQLENDLMMLFNFEHFDIVSLLYKNRKKILWCIRLAKAQSDKDRENIIQQLKENGEDDLIKELNSESEKVSDKNIKQSDSNLKNLSLNTKRKPILIDLESLNIGQSFNQFALSKIKLPEGSFKRKKKQYEEVHIPAPKVKPITERLLPVKEIPEWAQHAFSDSNHTSLNRVQSALYPAAFKSDENILLCAPTGAGKTNVALLTMLRTISHFRNEDGNIDLSSFKIVYIAPLKALVQEQVREFSKKLQTLGITVAELTGDAQLTKAQISETNVIITTPEKWDIITRKANEASYVNLVRLVIIDEIHLLHDERGPVIESIVARTIRASEEFGEVVRFVGLSATLPNYADVSAFLRVDPKKGLFYFDSSYRPCPLAQQVVGITEKKAIKIYQAMNDATYEKVMENAGKYQVIIFVHSRKETFRTAKFLRDKALEEETISNILQPDSDSHRVLTEEAKSVNNILLQDVLPYGFAMHHAGLTRADRTSVEELFEEGHIQVLVSTATLAWGVNLPAHTVIIKGTQIYSPEKGKWIELSPQDVIQMLGRAGRPKYDTFGEGIIISNINQTQYYLSLLNQQLSIESQFMSKLADNLNAEVALGTVRNIEEGIKWLGYTYLYIRMLRSPKQYYVGPDYLDDKNLVFLRGDLIHSASVLLEKKGLVQYDFIKGTIKPTELGRIASNYYISYSTMAIYRKLLKPATNDIEIFRLFSLSGEFKYIPVRPEEKLELSKLLERTPIPIKETINDPMTKVNVLLQAYISRLKLEGFALMSDMVYITQSAGRLLRAIFEICLRRNWATSAKTALEICQMAERRMWPTNTPLRQFPTCPPEVIRTAEMSSLPWNKYFTLTEPSEVGQAIRSEKHGRLVLDLLHKFPRVEFEVTMHPITSTDLRIEMTLTPKFTWDDKLHGTSQSFWIIVEDGNGEFILHNEIFIVWKRFAGEEHSVEFIVPITTPLPSNYFISVISDRWIGSETRLPVSFKDLILPKKISSHTALLDLQPLPISDLGLQDYIDLYSSEFTYFNKFQTQMFNTLYNTETCTFIGSAVGTGKTLCAELTLLRHWKQTNYGRAVYVIPFQEQVDKVYANWSSKFSKLNEPKVVSKLNGEVGSDLKTLEQSHVICCTPQQWDVLSRRWKNRKNVRNVDLFIADDAHLLGSSVGPVYEIVISRMRFIAAQVERHVRMVLLSAPLANGNDIGEWIGATQHTTFNFSPAVTAVPYEIQIQTYGLTHHASLMLSMAKPAFNVIVDNKELGNALVFVDSRQQAYETASDFVRYAQIYERENKKSLKYIAKRNAQNFKIKDEVKKNDIMEVDEERIEDIFENEDSELVELAGQGIGIIFGSMDDELKKKIIELYNNGSFYVLIASREIVWWLDIYASTVLIMGTQYYDGRDHRYVDYSLAEVHQMLGHTRVIGKFSSKEVKDEDNLEEYEDGEDSRVGVAVLMTNPNMKNYYSKYLTHALPVESQLHTYLHDAFVPEISTGIIHSRQDAIDWLTFTFFFRRIVANPSFYGLVDASQLGLSEYLSELVESTLNEMDGARMVTLDEDSDVVEPTKECMIAAYSGVCYVSMEMLMLSLNEKTKMRGLLEIITNANEFEENVPIRRHEDDILAKMYGLLPYKTHQYHGESLSMYSSPAFKSFILLQAHFLRLKLPTDLASDQKIVVERILNILYASVNILSAEGRLNTLIAMDVCQMVVQAMLNSDSPLKQIPHFNGKLIERCKESSVETVYDLMELEDKRREVLLGSLTRSELEDVVEFVNKYPNIEMRLKLEGGNDIGGNDIDGDEIEEMDDDFNDGEEDEDEEAEKKKKIKKYITGESITLLVKLERDGGNEEDDDNNNNNIDSTVISGFYPHKKNEVWWIVVGKSSSKEVFAIERITFTKISRVIRVEFVIPTNGIHELDVLCICDSYIGADQEKRIKICTIGEESDD